MAKLWSTCGAKMHRLKEKISRRLHRSRHKEPAADNQSTSPDCKRSDPIESAKKLSQKRSTSVSSKPSITNRSQHEEAVPRSHPETSRSLSTSDTRGKVSSVKSETKTSDFSLLVSSKQPDSDEGVSRNLWKEAFEKLSPDTQDGLRKRGYEPSLNTDQGDLYILLNDLRKKVELCDKERWVYKGKFVRDYAAKCATLVQGIGDLVIPFAPSQAAGPWGLIKVALKVPIEYDSTMFALLGTVDRALHAIIRGRQYESAYETENSDIVDTLRGDLVNVYWAVLKLLSYSIERLSEPTGARILATMLDNGSGHFSDLTAKEKELADTARACSAAQGEKATQHLQDIQGHLPRIENQVVECLAKLDQREAIDILDWVSTVKHKAHHDNVRNNRTPGTGDWLLRKAEFRDWEESSSSAVLWLRGSPGVGKTFLTSKVIDHIQHNLARTPNDEGFAYFYCNRNEDIRTRPLAVARSYVRQLSSPASKTKSSNTNSWHIQSTLQSTYKNFRMEGADLHMKCCTKLITESLNLYPRTTLVLDAFDECDPSSRGDLLELFTDLLSNSTRPVKLFIASRPDRDVQQQVRSHTNIEVQATDNQQDIEAYISQEMPRLIENNGAFRELREMVESTLSEKSQGMFQWTYLQLKQLERCVSSEAILECLQTLPETLDETYEGLLKEIERKPPHDRDLALRAFKWALAAREPLPREALLEAIRINPDNPAGGSTEDLSPVVELLERFLGAPQDSSAQYRIWARWYEYNMSLMPYEYSIFAVCRFGFRQVSDSWWNNGELDLAVTNGHGETYVLLAAEYGHIQILRILLAKGGTVGIQGKPDNKAKSTPLIMAAYYGHVELARFLLKDAKADVNLEVGGAHWGGQCALGAAIDRNKMDMLQLLILEGHAEVNMHLKCCGGPLAMAISFNWLEGTKFLVEQGGADVDMVLQCGPYGSALDAAASNLDSPNIKKIFGGS
ncbi:hypothetical protein AtubIFM54640_000913 [Aspergillus tubingensis]|nr:hypothetical protein AtubIFM54640_000913 [Aspergillus tubingensis]